jgi:hypothetical protein
MVEDTTGKNGEERRRWAERITGRKHPYMLWERGDHADYLKLVEAKNIVYRLSSEFEGLEILFDDKANGWIHKLWIPGDQEPLDNIFIVERDGSMEPFSARSKIIEKIPKQFWVIRIFAYFSDEAQKTAVLKRVKELESSH